MKNQQEKRMLPMTELRVNENESGAVIEGHAAVFDSWSETLGGIFPFVEKVSKGAFKDSIGKDDIRALFNHDPNYVLGRNLAGTLELEEDDVGLVAVDEAEGCAAGVGGAGAEVAGEDVESGLDFEGEALAGVFDVGADGDDGGDHVGVGLGDAEGVCGVDGEGDGKI